VVDPALFDTNILIDFLVGVWQAKEEIARYPDRAISIITWMEIMVGATSADEAATLEFLNTFVIFPITQAVAEKAVVNRRRSRMKLPDAIILATAQAESRLFISRDTKDFPDGQVGVRVPYKL
jgi:predicted nucleic acid-binding protein